jgi:hypothetical protein
MAIVDLGTVKPGTTIYIPFHTFSSDDPSASMTITGLAVTDIEIYKDGGTTQRASDAGYSLLDTDGIDFDTITGVHGISINLADNTTANFYEAGSQYWVVISSITLDAATVNFVLATFRIGYEGAVLDTTIATLASQTGFTLEDGPADNDALNGCPVIVHDLASAVQVAFGYVTDYVGATKTVTLAADPGIFTMAAGDNISFFPPTNAGAVWDEILSGATHNIASSAGRRLRAIQDYSDYEDGAVWIDTVGGTAGTVDFENGTVSNPVDSIADALTLAASVGLSRIRVLPGSSITFAASMDGYELLGDGWTLALNNQSCSATIIHGATVSGICTGAASPQFINCAVGTTTLPGAHLHGCQLTGTITLSAAGDYFFDQCFSGVAGTGTPSVDFGAAVLSTNLSMRHYSGGIEVQNIGDAGTDNMSLEGHGQLVINANSSGGTIAIRGNFTVIDNASGAVTLSDDARIDVDQVGDAAWDEPKAGHVTAGTTGEEIQSHSLSSEISALNDLSQADVFTYVVENSKTFEQFLRLMYSVLVNKSAGGGTATGTFRDDADTKNRVSATMDANGNRTAVGTKDGT